MIKRFLAAVAITVLAVTGVGISAVAANPLSDYYHQDLVWKGCGTGFVCADIRVPIDYAKPYAKNVPLSIIMHKATSANPVGNLLVNPGGPGSSGFDFVQNSVDQIGSKALRAQYNIVGFDPRGVQHSSPVNCFNARQMDTFLYGDSGYPLGSSKDLSYTRKLISSFSKACKAKTGELLGHVDTISAAKDMDILRALLGDSKLNYLGYSYGTLLGATYASLFPSKVGRMVLDGAIDPTVPDEAQTVNQLKGFDQALTDYLTDCLKGADCPFSGTVAQARAKISSFLLGLETRTIRNSDDSRPVNVWVANTGIAMALYSQDYWQYLTAAFNSAFKGDGTTLMRLADFYNDRQPDGSYASNQTEANLAVSCLDSRASASMTAMKKQNARLVKASSVFGRYWQFGALGCAYWPYPVVKPLKSYSAKGAPTIMVIGTTGDPATPYKQAQDLAHKVLAKGFLVTFKGEGHTAYGRSNSCVDDSVDNFLIEGSLPAKEPVC
mgnify:CR=1 FL=1